jgi:tight adherence protein B
MLSATACIATAGICAALLVLRQLHLLSRWWTGMVGQRTELELANLFVFIPAARLLALTTMLAVFMGATAWALGAPLALILVVTLLTLALPRIWSFAVRRRWRRQLVQQLPDALALWSGLLRAGQGTHQALAQVAQRQTGPLGHELRFMLGQVRMGVPLESAFASLRERAEASDLRLLATLLATQRELGGNLAESLQRLSDLLRNRLLMEARIGSLTSQGRMQGVVVGLLPVLLMAVLYAMEREAMQVLHTTWQGWAAIALIIALETAGFLMIHRIVNIRI